MSLVVGKALSDNAALLPCPTTYSASPLLCFCTHAPYSSGMSTTTAVAVAVDPASRSDASWRALLGNLKLRGAPDTDSQVIACHQGLAFHRARKVLEREVNSLSAPGVDRLVATLRQGAHKAIDAEVDSLTPPGVDRPHNALGEAVAR